MTQKATNAWTPMVQQPLSRTVTIEASRSNAPFRRFSYDRHGQRRCHWRRSLMLRAPEVSVQARRCANASGCETSSIAIAWCCRTSYQLYHRCQRACFGKCADGRRGRLGPMRCRASDRANLPRARGRGLARTPLVQVKDCLSMASAQRGCDAMNFLSARVSPRQPAAR
jgi:hypothetical protein